MSMSMSMSMSMVSAAGVNGGFQSGPSPGPFYSGGMSYRGGADVVWLTGSHYNTDLNPHDGSVNDLMTGSALDDASSCYIAKLDLAKEQGETFHSLDDWKSYGNPGKIETCSSVTATSMSDAFIVGSVGEGGLFSDGYPMQGLLSVLDPSTLEFLDATLIKSAEDPSRFMVYPLDVVHDNRRANIYIAALTSIDNVENTITDPQPNWHEQQKVGSGFDVTLVKINTREQKPSAEWVRHFPLDLEADGTTPPVFVAGIVLQKDEAGVNHVILSGSTRGTGDAFGPADPDSKDEDGFVVQLDPKDGSFMATKRHKGKDYTFQESLREGTDTDDFIKGICNNRGAYMDDGESDVFYIVGGTKGDMTTDGQGAQDDDDNAGFQFGVGVETKYRDTWKRDESLMPFLRQVSIKKDLAPNWTTQWAAMPGDVSSGQKLPSSAYAVDCFVDIENSVVFVVGNVMKGGRMSQGDVEMINQGGDDIWVAKVDELTGNVFWLTQLGSMADEKLAHYGSIAVNNDGNVLIYGDTKGNMYRQRGEGESKDTSDMFLMTIDGTTGAVNDKSYLGGTSSGSVASSINGVPPVVSVPPAFSPSKGPMVAPERTSAPNPTLDVDGAGVKPEQSKPKVQKGDKKSNAGATIGILFAITALLVTGVFVYSRQVKKQKAEAQKSSIFACLQQFDVEDIDLRRSPPGGWHGTYMNKLAYGVNSADEVQPESTPTSYEDAPLTHSSVAKDALFMEDSAKATGSDGNAYRDNFQIGDEDEVDVRLGSAGKII
uniref:Uncharacterized protein n=1 Tax=Pseudo-nitzschia australis TaxID=44445 RepID=A0A7S4ARS5_9STRA|mmetsp:Transcript_21850/g.47538  ORF Transcript_21850/g.47538 Transcript_21850/m.47538 type:complete len:770 (+) Transcript_21850:3-2312(+)